MRLVDLNPRWCGDKDAPPDAKQGVSFLCPHCRTQRLAVWFANPICGNAPVTSAPAHMADHHHVHGLEWQRTGDTFDALTLKPSINTEAAGHWHGFITNGAIA